MTAVLGRLEVIPIPSAWFENLEVDRNEAEKDALELVNSLLPHGVYATPDGLLVAEVDDDVQPPQVDQDRLVRTVVQRLPAILRAAQIIDTDQAAELLGLKSQRRAHIARQTLARWGVPTRGRGSGRSGKTLYLRRDVEQAVANRPGQGRRTDLQRAREAS